jgi:hypothetical protein
MRIEPAHGRCSSTFLFTVIFVVVITGFVHKQLYSMVAFISSSLVLISIQTVLKEYNPVRGLL